MELKLLFVLFIVFFLTSVFYSIKKTQDQIINAYSFFALEYFVKILFSSLLSYLITDEIVNYEASLTALSISFLFLFSLWFGFILDLFPRILLRNSKIFFMSTRSIRVLLNNLKLFGLLFWMLSLVFYVLLVIKGGGGSQWLTNSRYAYQHYREGAGAYYVFSQMFLYLSFILFMFSIKKKGIITILGLLFIFVAFFYFFGSKRSLLTLFMIAMVYYSYYVKNVSFLILFFAFIVLLLVFLGSQYLYSGYSLSDSVSYFEYFSNMVLFLELFPDFEYMHGESLLSTLWLLVPRELYPDKPYFYGTAYITEFIYPGLPEEGHFIGVLPWTSYYLDFGYVGVFFGGIVSGVFLQYLQLLFKYNKSIFVFVLFVNYGISNIFKHMPSFILFILTILLINFLRLRIYNK